MTMQTVDEAISGGKPSNRADPRVQISDDGTILLIDSSRMAQQMADMADAPRNELYEFPDALLIAHRESNGAN